jgi:hypothetical protein
MNQKAISSVALIAFVISEYEHLFCLEFKTFLIDISIALPKGDIYINSNNKNNLIDFLHAMMSCGDYSRESVEYVVSEISRLEELN